MMMLSVCLPTSSTNEWIHIALQVATIGRTWGFYYIPASIWFYLVPFMGALEVLMIITIVASAILYSRGLLVWVTKLKYVIYSLGFVVTMTLLPILYGMSNLFDCNWSTGYLYRDASMQCWNFTVSGSGVLAIGLLCCFSFFFEKSN